jgi:hypothetical protein
MSRKGRQVLSTIGERPALERSNGSNNSSIGRNSINHVVELTIEDERSTEIATTSSSIWHILYWTVAVFASIQVSRYGSLEKVYTLFLIT